MEGLKEVLSSEEFSWLNEISNLTEAGNFENGLNVLQLRKPISQIAELQNLSKEAFINHLEPILIKLRSVRNQRTRPKADTKIITDWNALAIIAFVQAGRLLDNKEYLQTARSASNFILENLNTEDGHLMRNWSQGQASQPGTLADYAGTILALHQLYEIDFSPKLYEVMQTISQTMQKTFESESVFYNDTAQDVPHLILQPSNLQDSVTPSGNAMACHSHWLLYQFENTPKHKQHFIDMLLNLGEMITEHPHSFGYWLKMADLAAHPTQQIALVSPDDITQLKPFITHIHQTFSPYTIVAAKTNQNQSESAAPAFCLHRSPQDNKPSAFICENFTCHLPITDIEDFKKEIN
jgi:uncharacterized protein YyaL (SSP411 family)